MFPGVIALADGIKNSGALEKLNISNNSLGKAETGQALGEMLKANAVLKELDVSNNTYAYYDHGWKSKTDPGFAAGLADGLSANGALETITFGDNQAVTMKTVMIEADFSGKELGVSGAIIVAAFLPKCQ